MLRLERIAYQSIGLQGIHKEGAFRQLLLEHQGRELEWSLCHGELLHLGSLHSLKPQLLFVCPSWCPTCSFVAVDGRVANAIGVQCRLDLQH